MSGRLDATAGRRVRYTAALALAALCVAAASGCAGRRHGAAAAAPPGAVYGPVTVFVENGGTYEAVVYAVRGTFRQRMGNVPGLSKVRLNVPASFTREPAPFALLVTQISGSATYTTDAFVGQPDLQVRLMLAPRLSASSFSLQ